MPQMAPSHWHFNVRTDAVSKSLLICNALLLVQLTHAVTSCAVAFFSDDNLSALSERLGHDRTRELLNDLQTRSRALQTFSIDLFSNGLLDHDAILAAYSQESRLEYMQAYFDEIHPIYPFLHRQAIETGARNPRLADCLRNDIAWAALYYTIISLGILLREGGSVEAIANPAWKMFNIALRSYPRLLFVKKSQAVAQAMIAMAIFALNYSSWNIEELMITEAARMAIALQLNKPSHDAGQADDSVRAFWVIYCIEKEYSFNSTQSSVINDGDISCPLPSPSLRDPADADWLAIQVSFCRILSDAYVRLFSAAAISKTRQAYAEDIALIHESLQDWTASVPEQFRPELPIRPRYFTRPHLNYATLQIHFTYYNLKIALSRVLAHAYGDWRCAAVLESTLALMRTARHIVEALQYVPLEVSTPMNILSFTPVVATFILFDFVVYNPDHSETKKNMAYLEIAAGYFQRLGVAFEGSSSHSFFAELPAIARDYLRSHQATKSRRDEPLSTQTTTSSTTQYSAETIPTMSNHHGVDSTDQVTPVSLDAQNMDRLMEDVNDQWNQFDGNLNYPIMDAEIDFNGCGSESDINYLFGQHLPLDAEFGIARWP